MKNILINYYKKHLSTSNRELPSKMKAVLQKGIGGTDVLYIGEADLPELKDESEVLINVTAFALNRADILQRQGKYPPPKGVTDILGLECAGYLVENGKVNKNKRVMALLPGGGYAEYVKVNKDHIIPIPDNISTTDAAAIPEVWITAFQLCSIAGVNKNDTVLIHAAASGVGTALIQLINKYYQGKSISICSTEEKLKFCQKLGSNFGVFRKDEQRVPNIMSFTNKKGCDVILDCVGSSEFENNLNCAAIDARWINYGTMGGVIIKEFNFAKFLGKRIHFDFTTLRTRSDEYKKELIDNFKREILPKFSNKEVHPIIDRVFTVDQIKEAHERMEKNENIGKILIEWKI